MNFTAQDVAKLRAQTGVGMMECKKALTDANGDFEKAIVLLRERGLRLLTRSRAELQARVWCKVTSIWVEGLVFCWK